MCGRVRRVTNTGTKESGASDMKTTLSLLYAGREKKKRTGVVSKITLSFHLTVEDESLGLKYRPVMIPAESSWFDG